MKSVGMLNLAALVAAATIMALAAVLFPDYLTSNVSIATLVIFALSVGFMFYVPSILVRDGAGSNAASMASLGMAGTISTLLLITTAIGFFLALAGYERVAIAADIFAVGGLIVGGLVLRSALVVVGGISASSSTVSKHSLWQQEMKMLSGVVRDDLLKKDLERVSEKLRYSASDVIGGAPQDADIDGLLGESKEALFNDRASEVKGLLLKVETLLAQREVFLRSARSKA